MIFQKNIESETKALVEISWTNPNLNPKGKIVSIIGKKGEHETEMQSILLDKGIVYKFPENVEKEAEKVAEEMSKTPFEMPRSQRASLTFLAEEILEI